MSKAYSMRSNKSVVTDVPYKYSIEDWLVVDIEDLIRTAYEVDYNMIIVIPKSDFRKFLIRYLTYLFSVVFVENDHILMNVALWECLFDNSDVVIADRKDSGFKIPIVAHKEEVDYFLGKQIIPVSGKDIPVQLI